MKLNDIQSKVLLPRFANNIEWVQNTLDVIIKRVCERSKSIDAPLTMESIEALTDEELQALYEQYGIAIYYPDLSRETRNKMLYEMCRVYRYLGTPKALETLCNYIFDGIPIQITVNDNQAFDELGNLVRPDLIDTFDVIVDPQMGYLGEDVNKRILENIIHFSRNSQSLLGICYDFEESFDLNVNMGVDQSNPVCIIDYENDEISVAPKEYKEPYGVFAYWGDQLSVPSGYKIAWIKCNVAYTFPKYYTTDGVNVEVYYDGKDVYSDRITAGMIQDPPVNPDSPETYPRVRIYQGDTISGGYPKMVGLDFSCGDTYSDQGNVVEAAAVNGTDPVHGDYFIYYKAHSYDGTSRYGILSNNFPARLFWWDSYVDSGVYAFNLPRSLYSVLNGELQWLGDTTDQQDLAWYYANDWQGQIRFDVYLVGIDEEPGRIDGYFSKDGAFASGDDVIGYIYGPDGFPILYDPNKTYIIRKVYMKDGTEVQFYEHTGIYHGMLNYGTQQYDAIYVHDLSGYAFRIVLDVT